MPIRRLSKLVRISLFAALIAISSMIAIPFPVPLTLQTFAIFAALMTLGGKDGAIAIIVYVCLGLVGLPVFAGFGSGFGYISGATGGFVVGFVIAALLYALLEAFLGDSHKAKIVYSFISLAVIYAVGNLWFCFVYSSEKAFFASLAITCLPYFIPDCIKIFLAAYVSKRLETAAHI